MSGPTAAILPSRIMVQNNSKKAVAYSSRLLAIRPRSEKELTDRLVKKRFGRTIVAEVISHLKDKGFVDDLKFASAWVESRANTNPKGRRLLWKELRNKGVPAPIIDQALSGKKEDEAPLARILAKKRLARMENATKYEAKRKLYAFLLRRGFDYSVIEEVVHEITQNTN